LDAKPGCRACRLLPAGARSFLDTQLAAGYSSRSLSKKFASLSRRDIERHAAMCPRPRVDRKAGKEAKIAKEGA
jgi:hypothetical protein